MSIQLHPTLGVNPKLCYCPRCGGESNTFMLIGNRTSIKQCADCGTKLIGHRSYEPCGKCGSRGPHATVGEVGENDKLPGDICEGCKAEISEHKKLVEAGGIYFKCKTCSATGVVKAETRLAKAVREKSGIAAPAPVGVEFDTCEQHGGRS
jgi:hypothetical protein